MKDFLACLFSFLVLFIDYELPLHTDIYEGSVFNFIVLYLLIRIYFKN